jgi:ectoine hydroxylase-related dioxygenase (phytanoyl-CoA dioxygenase family)
MTFLLRARPTDWKGTNKLSLWVAIDDATVSNGCLKVVPESHGHVFPHEQHTEAIAFDSRVNGASVSDEQMSVPLEAGSVLFFHDLLLHASNPNTNGKDRYCMIPTYRSVEDNDPVRVPLAETQPVLGFGSLSRSRVGSTDIVLCLPRFHEGTVN